MLGTERTCVKSGFLPIAGWRAAGLRDGGMAGRRDGGAGTPWRGVL